MLIKLLSILVILASALEVTRGEVSTACYGTDPACDYYTMQCSSSEIIKLYNLYAGYKSDQNCSSNSTSHCNNKDPCCSLKPGDSIESFKLENVYNTYTNCSGRQICRDVQAPWQLMTSLLPDVITSTFVQLEYGCETASSKIPLCGGTTGSVSGVYSYAEIIFDGSVEKFDPLKASKECRCSVENTGLQQNIIFKMIDVRLQSYHKDINQTSAACSSAELLTPGVIAAHCVDTMQHYSLNFYHNRTETLRLGDGEMSEISLTNIHKNWTYDSPAMVWISLQADASKNFRLTCEEVIPALFTTSTSTTTTTPTTTTTSTTTTTPSTTTTTTTRATTTSTTTTPATTNTTTTPTTTSTTTTPATTSTTTTPATTSTTSTPTTTSTTTTPATTSTTTTPTTTSTTTTTTTTKPTTTTTTTTSTTTTTTKPTTVSPTTTSTTTPTTTSTTTTTTKPTTTCTSTTTSSTTTTTTSTTTSSTIRSSTTLTSPPSASSSSTTTSSTTTSQTSTKVPIPPIPVTPESTTKQQTTPSKVPLDNGEASDEQRITLFLAIAIPIIVGVLVIVGILLWVFWKRTLPRRRKFNFLKDPAALRNSKILDQFIDAMGVDANSPAVIGSEKSPMSSFISIPTTRSYVKEYRPNQSFRSNGSVYNPTYAIEPYTIPIRVDESSSYTPDSPRSPVSKVIHVRLGTEGEPTEGKQVQPAVTKNPANTQNAKPKDETDTKSKKKDFKFGDGSVLIHVDNLSLPTTPRKTSSVNTSSTQSVAGSSPRELTPDRRDSNPAIIDTEPFIPRHSATAHVFPGATTEENSVLFVANK